MKTIIELSPKDAKKYFLNQKNYFNFELPEYFDFSKILKKLENTSLSKSELSTAKNIENINYSFISNKDGKYDWRRLQIIHPALYSSLVNIIISEWPYLQKKFKEFKDQPSVLCVGLPIVPDGKMSQKAGQINKWSEEVEKQSVRLGLEYKFIFHADISNCYGSIYTHSISWALDGKEVSKKAKKEGTLSTLKGTPIDNHLQAMSYGQTNGIPQGSVLMDFIAEIVLGYSDVCLSRKLESLSVDTTEYKIIRYRDDYRVFVNSANVGEIVLRAISEILIELGMKLNTKKTKQSVDIIQGAIKPDKWFVKVFGSDVPKNPKKMTIGLIRKELLFIHHLGLEFPNSGSVQIRLKDLYELITKQPKKKFKTEQVVEFISLTVNIALVSPRVIPISAGFMSFLLNLLKTDQEKLEILNTVERRFKDVSNTGYIEVWLQRITMKIPIEKTYSEPLCKYLEDDSMELFESYSFSQPIREATRLNIFNEKVFNKMNKVMAHREVDIFCYDD